MPDVRRSRRRRPATLVALLALVAYLFLPEEHIHVARTHNGHQTDLVHRHFEPHHPTETRPVIDRADDEHDVQWVTTAFTRVTTVRMAAPASVAIERRVADSLLALVPGHLLRPRSFSIHDPPWAIASPFRAPPALSL
jgi:hypothetical protein